ncbi:MAG TPA: type II toxin-antitoxin system PemK/MazF family toxin [Vicinamibacterales bacterium]|jgi:mRNA interferase MazF|nr:type II toxin-antitoxin system PemK/MazF family toxin [Vicinamibacterales bacterium]
MQAGEVYLARFPFGDVPGMKLRPVLLLTGAMGAVPEILVAYISSVLPARPLPSDLILDPAEPPFQATHLKVPSVLRLRKLATIHVSSLARHLGVLDVDQQAGVVAKLRALLGL